MATENGKINSEDYNKALKTINKLYTTQKNIEKSTEKMNGLWDSISSTVLGVSGSEFYEKVAKSSADIAKQADDYKLAATELDKMGGELDKSFKKMKSLRKAAANISLDFNESQVKANLEAKIRNNASDALLLTTNGIEDVTKELMDLAKKGEKIDKKKLRDLGIMEESLNDMLKFTKETTDNLNEEIRLPKQFQFLNVLGNEYLKKKYLQAIAEGRISDLVDDQGMVAANVLNTNEEINKKLGTSITQYGKSAEELEEIRKKTLEVDKVQFSLVKGLKKWGDNLVTSVIKKMTEFDNIIHRVQKDTGIMFTQNEFAMTKLTKSTAQFGMSIEDTAQFMGIMSDTLNTTNFPLLSKATEDLKAIQLATGMSAESLGTMAAEMMRMGESSTEVKQNIISANQTAKMFGVNSKKALESISKNFVKFRSMGFEGGEKSLQKMVATSLRLGQNIDEVFNMADKARNIEGAMEMAAQLQLAGGSFANVNPMDLLASARKGPQELQKILGQMGKDIGKFDEKTGKMTFDPVDKDRLQIVADATGETLEGIQNRITKMNQDNTKLNLMPAFKFDGIMDQNGKEIDPEGIKAQLSDSVDMAGKVLKGSFLDKQGITDLSKLSQQDLERVMKKKAIDDANIEKQAKENQSLMDSFTALKDAFLNMFTTLQPIMDVLTKAIQWLSEALKPAWVWIPLLIVALTAFALRAVPTLIASLGSMWSGGKDFLSVFKGGFKGIGKSIKDKFMGGGNRDELSDKINSTQKKGTEVQGAPKGEGGLKSLAEGLKAMGDVKVLFGVGVTALAGPALLLLLPGIPTLLLMAIVGTLGGLIVAGFEAIRDGFKAISKISPVEAMKGAFVMALIGASMIPFAYALNKMGDVSWAAVIAALGFMIVSVMILEVLGGMLTGPQIVYLLVAVAALIVIALSLVVFAYAMQLLAVALSKMAEIDAMALLKIMLVLAVMAPVLLALGIVGAIVAIPLMVLAASLMILGPALSVLATGLQSLSTVNWASFDGVGTSLMALAAGLTLFALAGLVFMNPIMLVGMMLMIGTLAAISFVLIPLAQALDLGGKGLDSMAEGVMKLSDSLQKLDFEKLGQLKDFSTALAFASISGGAIAALADAIGKLNGGGKSGGGGGAGTEQRPIIIQLKMNGRTLEEHIIKSLDQVS